ncbi:MAG: TOBE domain-containing protein, partial [Desulfarculaceae bacterium]|nr:TOBE domain-containing protein [Desulfarculaceae bacterium]
KPAEIYNHPAGRTVAGFLGFRNILAATVGADAVDTDCGKFSNVPEKNGTSGAEDLLILPDAARLISKEVFDKESVNVLEAKVVDVAFKGSINTLAVEVCGGHTLYFDMFKSRPPAETGSIVHLAVDPDRLRLI